MRPSAHRMLTIAVAIYGQPVPPEQPGEIYQRFMAYRRLGRFVVTGKVG